MPGTIEDLAPMQVRLPRALRQRVRQYVAREEGRTARQVITKAIVEYLERNEIIS